jgi:hypothetical protein
MDNPGAAWAVIISNPELRQGLIREAARSRRSDRAASSRRYFRQWLILVARGLVSRLKPTTELDPRPVTLAGLE